MQGTTGLHDLQLSCRIGVEAAERSQAQRLSVDVALETDIAAAVCSQALGDAIDYNAIADALRDVAEREEFKLMEALAEAMTTALLQRFAAVTRVSLEVRKPGAIEGIRDCFVRLERQG